MNVSTCSCGDGDCQTCHPSLKDRRAAAFLELFEAFDSLCPWDFQSEGNRDFVRLLRKDYDALKAAAAVAQSLA